jgi:hypothetical protein
LSTATKNPKKKIVISKEKKVIPQDTPLLVNFGENTAFLAVSASEKAPPLKGGVTAAFIKQTWRRKLNIIHGIRDVQGGLNTCDAAKASSNVTIFSGPYQPFLSQYQGPQRLRPPHLFGAD